MPFWHLKGERDSQHPSSSSLYRLKALCRRACATLELYFYFIGLLRRRGRRGVACWRWLLTEIAGVNEANRRRIKLNMMRMDSPPTSFVRTAYRLVLILG